MPNNHSSVPLLRGRLRLYNYWGNIKSYRMTAVTTNTRPQRFFSWGSNLGFGGRQSTFTMVFHALAQSRFFPCFDRALGRTCWRLIRFCNILLQDPAQLHVKITRSTNLLSVCRRKLKLSTYTHCKLQPHKLSQCTPATRLSSC